MDLAQSAEAGTPVVGRDRQSAAMFGRSPAHQEGHSNVSSTPDNGRSPRLLLSSIGYGAATEVVAISAKLHADIARMNAMRKAESRPSLEEDDAEDKAFSGN